MKSASELLAKGETFEEKGDYVRAARFYHKALAQQERTSGKQDPELVPYLYNLGMVQCALENNAEAEWTLTRLLTILVKSIGEAHEDVREVRSLLCELKTAEVGIEPQMVVNG